MTWQNPMQRLRQRHADKSQSVIEFRPSKWQVQVTVIRASASSISCVEIRQARWTPDKHLAAKTMKKQNAGHSCTEDCLDWQEF